MLDIHSFLDGGRFAKALDRIDTNHDGVISPAEIQASSQDVLDALRDHAHSVSEWSVVREIALIKGTYRSLDGVTKGTMPGQGGRFDLMVDSLTERGYAPEIARAIAAKVGKAKYAWM